MHHDGIHETNNNHNKYERRKLVQPVRHPAVEWFQDWSVHETTMFSKTSSTMGSLCRLGSIIYTSQHPFSLFRNILCISIDSLVTSQPLIEPDSHSIRGLFPVEFQFRSVPTPTHPAGTRGATTWTTPIIGGGSLHGLH